MAARLRLFDFEQRISPPASSPARTLAAPTGIVLNGTGGFQVSKNGVLGSAPFIFATEDGPIVGWSRTVDRNNAGLVVDNSTRSATSVDHSVLGAVYKGLAMGSVGGARLGEIVHRQHGS